MTFPLRPARLHAFLSLAALALLSACAGQPVVNQSLEAEQYQSRAARDYTPPGPPGDPWGPYIVEAAARFDVPNAWVRAVMRVESGGRLYEGGGLITSPVGAMGLMQVMPETYDGLRERYSLSDDAYDPHNNILAGTAYIREMYDLYGSPGFLAAYNAGPARLDDYLNNRRGLPDETRHYVAKAGPNVIGIFPDRRSPADELAMNQLPLDIPSGLRYGRPHTEARVAQAPHKAAAQVASRNSHANDHVLEVAQMPEPPRFQSALARGQGLHLIAPVSAEAVISHHGGNTSGRWAIQMGNYGNDPHAHPASALVKPQPKALVQAHATATTSKPPHSALNHARVTGLSQRQPAG